MAWFKGDDKSHNNRKLLSVQLLGTGLHWMAVSWCSEAESDGFLPASVVPSLSPELTPKARKALVVKMVTAGLWAPHENASGVVTDYEIHDFLFYNPSHDFLEQKRKKERARLAGKREET